MTEACWQHVFPGHPPQQGPLLVLHFRVEVKRLVEEEKRYPWPRPARCPRCRGRRLWGHGYVRRYFEGFVFPLWMKRWRCPDCRGVHTARLGAFWPRFRYSIQTILRALRHKILHGRGLAYLSRQLQDYWYQGLRFQASQLRNRAGPGLDVLADLLRRGLVPVTHTIQSERRRL
jgi:hypothetical protein